jgi:hypothetical protein
MLEDVAYLVMFEDIYIAYTKFYDTNSEMYTYSRLAANMRTQNYRSNSASSSQSHTQNIDFVGGPTRMASVSYSQNDSDEEEIPPISFETILEEAIIEENDIQKQLPEESLVHDIDSIENYIPRNEMIDFNITRTQINLSREASSGVNRSYM